MNEESLFAVALEKTTPANRRAFLDQACAGDAALRRRLDRLLAADERAHGILETGQAAGATRTDGLRSALVSGCDFAGRFRLGQRLGEGGMGEVWVAEQLEPVRRRVALKVLRPGFDSLRLLARFEQERQALAVMDHPNIATVLDAGLDDAGRSYFAMELIDGVPITTYCDENRLTPRERLELFVPVCHAVQHAHQKGVIHRDLKPSNILVGTCDGKPEPKVIDFGVAKATGGRLIDRSVATEVGTVIGTPEYMSPEQANLNDLDVDTRSDVYALGAVLYELLTGVVPFSREEPRAAAFTDLLRLIKEVDPPTPSARLAASAALSGIAAARRTDAAKLTALVRGELDWIVMKCLEKDRARRYDTADGLARDLERYLRDEPVLAVPPSAGYRLRKFVRRHRGPVLAATAVLLALVAGVIGTSWGLVDAVQARKGEADLRRETNRLLVESEWMLYASRINLAQQAWESNNASLAFHHLDSCRPDFRGWEYDYLFTLFHSNHRTYGNWGIGEDSDGVASMAVSRDGKRIATTGLGTVNVWNADTGERILNLRGHTAGVVSVAFSPDGKRVASGGHDNTVIVWDADTGERTLSLSGHKHHIQCVAFSPDGKRIAGGADETMKVWDAVTGELALTVPIPMFPVKSVAFSPDGKRIVGGQSNQVHVWDAHTGKTAVTLRWNSPSGNCVAFNPKGGVIASGGDDRTISLWNASTGERSRTFQGHTEPVTSVAFSLDGQFIVSGSEDKTVRIWDMYSGLEVRALKGHMDVVTSVAPMPDGKRIVSGSRDGTIKVWDAVWGEGERQETRVLRRDSGSIIAMALSPDGRRVASGRSNSPHVELWETATPWRNKPLIGHMGSLHGIAFSPDGKRIASGNGDRTVKVWGAHTFKELVTLTGHTHGIASVAWSPDGSRVLSGSSDHTVKIWDASSGQEIRTLAGHTGVVFDVAWSPDGNRILSGSWDRTVKVWDAATGAEIRTLTGHALEVYSVAWSPDGNRILSGSGDKTVKIWDAATGAEIRTLRGHGDRVRRVAVIPNHRRIVTAGWDGTLKVWDADTGYETLTLKAHTTVVSNIAVSADGKLIVSGGGDRMVKAWYAGLSWLNPGRIDRP